MIERTCPSGMKLMIRGLKGRELRHFEDRKAIKDGSVLDNVLSACVEEVIDPGPYSFATVVDDGEGGGPEPAKPDWKKILLGDEFFTFVAVRAATFGQAYSFKVQCQQRMCKHRFEWTLQLSDLPVKMLSEESLAAVRSGELLSADIAGGVKYRLLTGAEERALFKTRTAENPLVSNLALSIVELAGEKDSTKIRRALENMDLGVLQEIRETLDKSDCGIETKIEVECPECETVQGTNLPLGPGFLLSAKAG